MVTELLNTLIDFFLPKSCFHCGKTLIKNENCLCSFCSSKINTTTPELLSAEFERKFGVQQYVNDFYSPFIFDKEGPLQSLIHNLKYSSQFKVGIWLGFMIYEKAAEKLNLWQAEAIIPVPLHRLKKAARGYNQTEFIAKGIAKKANLNIFNPLKRIKYTETQTQFSANERKENIKDAFAVKKKSKLPGAVILIDDVITTGSTINEAAKTLKESFKLNIFALSLAIPKLEE